MAQLVDSYIVRRRIHVDGIVQGVGFRPFIYRLALNRGLGGSVWNDSQGVVIEVEGQQDAVAGFESSIAAGAPPQSRIYDILARDVPVLGSRSFRIRESARTSASATLISPDIATCPECRDELLDPGNRRYRYPFINCTNCGPRYSIVHRIPYDRPNTSMRVFPMCAACQKEYDTPSDRRFHAQPNACPRCGPQLTLVSATGSSVYTTDPLSEAIALLSQGRIVAIRGLGGYHLAVDAANEAAVRLLRTRKGRQGKPFALMAPDVEAVKRYCHVSKAEEELMNAPMRPIVLLETRGPSSIAASVAPRQRYLGFMLPYTPLHHLLLQGPFDALVMTSANLSEEPIVIGNAEALRRLHRIADFVLMHDREILQRCDDSVMRVTRARTVPIRRSRGYVPTPVMLAESCSANILAVGGHLKNTIALSTGPKAFLSQHIGDLDNLEALVFFRESIDHFKTILEIKPSVLACDLHPEYQSTKWAIRQSMPCLQVQHHHAHLASVMADNGVTEPTIGIILDGTGYGTDGTIWGGEVLVGDACSFARYAHLEPFSMPGGEQAILKPWRLALSLLLREYADDTSDLDLSIVKALGPLKIARIQKMIAQDVNAPVTSSAGRLFDAVSALLGICSEITYEAQAAIELEMAACGEPEAAYPIKVESTEDGALRTGPLIRAIVADLLRRESPARIAARFHASLAGIFVEAALDARASFGIKRVGLSGGVFQNMLLYNLLCDALEREGFIVLSHRQVPSNDGGLALGQIAVAAATLNNGGFAPCV